jgi:hypothetical protein
VHGARSHRPQALPSFLQPTSKVTFLIMAQDLRLDGNNMMSLQAGALGPHASALRKLSLYGSEFASVSRHVKGFCLLQDKTDRHQ